MSDKKTIALVVALLIVACSTDRDKSKAAAARFASEAGWKTNGVACQEYDSDDNGYVSCTIFRQDADPYAVECPSSMSLNSCASDGECKPAAVKTK